MTAEVAVKLEATSDVGAEHAGASLISKLSIAISPEKEVPLEAVILNKTVPL